MKKKITPKVPAVTRTYETEIEFTCPVRGKVKQKVLVQRLESMEETPAVEEVLPSKSITEQLDRKFSGILVPDDSLDDEHSPEEADDNGNSLH